MLNFNVPPYTENSGVYIRQAIDSRKICGDGPFSRLCSQWMERNTGAAKALLTTSCTHALEMAALLADIRPGDEVIMPSYTFVSTANAFVLRGASIVFVDIRPDTMNMDERLVEAAVTNRTKAVVPVHYAGVACEMDAIAEIAKRHSLYIIEDAAQAVMSTYKGRALGVIGDFGCYSFHETKNYSMGEGGALLIGDRFIERAEIIREKGTDRSKFCRGLVDKYTWVDIGSSYLPSELNAAYLMGQLDIATEILNARMQAWNAYYESLSALLAEGQIELPYIPSDRSHNAHMFWIKTADIDERTELIAFLRKREISSAFHYIPLHSSPAGRVFGRFEGSDTFTTRESERLLRLPLYYGLTYDEAVRVAETVTAFYRR